MLQLDESDRRPRKARALLAAFAILAHYPVLIPLAFATLLAQLTYSGINNVSVPQYIGILRLPREGAVIGALTATFLLAETALRVPFGWLSDRIGRARLIVGALLLSAPSVLASALAPSYHWLFPLRAWDGMMAAALWPSIYALIGDHVPERVRANAMGSINMMYLLALFIGGALGLGLYKATGNPRAFFLLGGALFAAGGALIFTFFRRQPQLQTPPPETQQEEAASAPAPIARHAILLTITFTQTFAITVLAPFMIRYATDPVAAGGLGFNMRQLALLVGAPMVGVGIFALPLSRLSDILGKLTAVRLAFGAIAVMLWVFAFFQQLPVLALTAMVIGVAFSMGIPAWLAILSSLSGRQSRGMTLAGYGAVQGVASVLGPIASGWVWDHIGHSQIFLLSAASVSLAALLAWTALPRQPSHTQKQLETV